MNPVQTTRLRTSDEFNFACHKNLSCFTACCAALNLILTPYDVIRLKKRLALSSGDFLKIYTYSFIDKTCGIPVVRLKMDNDGQGRCPFVGSAGCNVYTDRPGACRIYPLGQASSRLPERQKSDAYYFIIQEAHCRGFEENKKWQVAAWIRDQGLDVYNAMNEFYLDIATGKNFRRIKALGPQQLQMFYMGCYNIDEFRNFVFKSSFIKRFEIEPEQLDRLKTDDVELMKFACRWLQFALFGEKTMRLKTDALVKTSR